LLPESEELEELEILLKNRFPFEMDKGDDEGVGDKEVGK